MSQAIGIWQRDTLTNDHYLPIDGDFAMKVYRTVVGDYAITCHDDSVGFGGEVDYAANLRAAKREAERLAQSGEWRRYTP